jgi:carbonic anhydrase
MSIEGKRAAKCADVPQCLLQRGMRSGSLAASFRHSEPVPSDPAMAKPSESSFSDRMLLPARLIEGYESFLGGRFRREQDRYRQLAQRGQSPRILLIGCCDSRVSPEVIFDAHPGEIFVVRNIANLVPPYAPDAEYHGTSAALEYAIAVLQVAHIVVMGHAGCGGVRAYVEQFADSNRSLAPGDFIGRWISLLAPAASSLGPRTEPVEIYAERLGHAAILGTLANLRSFPYVVESERAGRLSLHGAYFGVADGRLYGLDEANGTFHPVAAHAHAEALGQSQF